MIRRCFFIRSVSEIFIPAIFYTKNCFLLQSKKFTAANEKKLQKGILTQSNYTLVNKSVIKSEVGGNLSIASTVPDYANFKKVRREREY